MMRMEAITHQSATRFGIVHLDVESGDVGVTGLPPHCQRPLRGNDGGSSEHHGWALLMQMLHMAPQSTWCALCGHVGKHMHQ